MAPELENRNVPVDPADPNPPLPPGGVPICTFLRRQFDTAKPGRDVYLTPPPAQNASCCLAVDSPSNPSGPVLEDQRAIKLPVYLPGQQPIPRLLQEVPRAWGGGYMVDGEQVAVLVWRAVGVTFASFLALSCRLSHFSLDPFGLVTFSFHLEFKSNSFEWTYGQPPILPSTPTILMDF